MSRTTTLPSPIGEMTTEGKCRRKADIRKLNIRIFCLVKIRFDFVPPARPVCSDNIHFFREFCLPGHRQTPPTSSPCRYEGLHRPAGLSDFVGLVLVIIKMSCRTKTTTTSSCGSLPPPRPFAGVCRSVRLATSCQEISISVLSGPPPARLSPARTLWFLSL